MATLQAKPKLDIADLLRRAVALHQRGQLSEAEAFYRQVLAAQPGNFDALHLCGVLLHQRGQAAEALKFIARALKTNSRSAAAHSNYGIVLAVLDRHEEALRSYERAVALKPDYAEAFNNRGNTLRALKRNEDALVSFERAIAARPNYAEAINNRGNALVELGRCDEALASYERALERQPDYADAMINRGKCLILLKRSDEALASFDRALKHQPRNAAALKERGHLLRDRKQPTDALSSLDQALALGPDNAETHAGRALALLDLKRFDEAFIACDRALALKPDYVEAIVTRGNILHEMRSYAEAIKHYDRALEMRADFAQAYGNRANTLVELNRPAEALADYDRALAIKPYASALVNRGLALSYLDRPQDAFDSFDRAITLEPELAEAHWNKALLYLSIGDFAQGWRGYEWRWRRATELTPRDFTQPQWRGEDLTGKIILLHAEQGFGDSIQFIRYLPMVRAKAERVILELPDGLLSLIGELADGVTMLNRGAALPSFDLHCPLMSLPLAFGTTISTIPASVPYLRAPADRLAAWRARMSREATPRVGLVWSGRADHKNDHNRSIALSRLQSLLAVPDVRFISLQKEYREADLVALNSAPIMRLDATLNDFADTAAVISELDLVIAVDTATAHLAGAMGKPLWLLLSYIQDWRWMRGRADSPWYPTAMLFRQPEIGDWDAVIARVAQKLTAFVKKRVPRPSGNAGQFSA
jgi:tetratricopeptide (TPR) repeat protein